MKMKIGFVVATPHIDGRQLNTTVERQLSGIMGKDSDTIGEAVRYATSRAFDAGGDFLNISITVTYEARELQ